MEEKAESVVPYIDPVHDEDECRIVSLHISPGKGTESGFVSHFNDDEAAAVPRPSTKTRTRSPLRDALECLPVGPRSRAPSALIVQEKTDGLRPFRQFLKIKQGVSAVIAHGADANAFLTLFEKTYHSSLNNDGVKIYKATALGGRAFAVSAAKQEELLAKNVEVYRDAMQRAGIQHL